MILEAHGLDSRAYSCHEVENDRFCNYMSHVTDLIKESVSSSASSGSDSKVSNFNLYTIIK